MCTLLIHLDQDLHSDIYELVTNPHSDIYELVTNPHCLTVSKRLTARFSSLALTILHHGVETSIRGEKLPLTRCNNHRIMLMANITAQQP
jgi:hypothetical protein